jgi:hypothetical protein
MIYNMIFSNVYFLFLQLLLFFIIRVIPELLILTTVRPK